MSCWVSYAGWLSCPGSSEELPAHLGPTEKSASRHHTLGSLLASKTQGHTAFYEDWYLQGRTGDTPSSDLAPSHNTAGSGSCGTESPSPPKREWHVPEVRRRSAWYPHCCDPAPSPSLPYILRPKRSHLDCSLIKLQIYQGTALLKPLGNFTIQPSNIRNSWFPLLILSHNPPNPPM